MDKKIKQKFAVREAAKKEGKSNDPDSNVKSLRDTSDVPSHSGDKGTEVVKNSKSDSKAAVSFRMPIGDVDYTSEVSECDSLNNSFSSAKSSGAVVPGTKEGRSDSKKHLNAKTVAAGKTANLLASKKPASTKG